MPALEPSSQHTDPQFAVHVAKAKWLNFAASVPLSDEKSSFQQSMWH